MDSSHNRDFFLWGFEGRSNLEAGERANTRGEVKTGFPPLPERGPIVFINRYLIRRNPWHLVSQKEEGAWNIAHLLIL